MAVELYQISFDGQILQGFDPEEVKANLKDLFRITDERVERIFNQSGTVLRSNLSHQEALVYHDRLTKAGARVQISLQSNKAAAKAPDPAIPEAPVPPAVPPTSPASDAVRQPGGSRAVTVQFSGRGGEYFGIWIVNILLTIVTLGIYSAWATVRNRQYFYGNTSIDGSSFQYLANPITILKGRLIALAVLVLYVTLSELYVEVALAFAVVFVFLVPWIMIRSLRFNAINSAYRNIRFDFQGRYGQAFMVTFIWPLLNMLCLLLLTPLVMLKTHQFVASGSRYGTTPFQFNATAGQYYAFFGKALLMVIGFAAVAFAGASFIDPVVGIVVGAVGYITLIGYFLAGVSNLYISSASLDSHRFESRLEPARMFWIYFSNSLLIGLTLGLFTPWAKVRMARYRASCTQMLVHGDLNHFVAAEQNRTSALGQELGDAFDVEFAAI